MSHACYTPGRAAAAAPLPLPTSLAIVAGSRLAIAQP